jgi:hypothetical protein
VLDQIVALVIVILVIELNALVVFVAALVLVFVVNLGCLTWIDHHWDGFAKGPGKRMEKRLSKWRTGRVMRHPINWVTHGSDASFAVAAALLSAMQVAVIARLATGTALGARRRVLAASGYSIFAVGLATVLGVIIGETI